MGKLKVIKAGMMATIQDMGRYGNRKYGIPQSGAMDLQSLKLANYLVGNPLGYPAVETAMQGIQLEALEHTIAGFTGAETTITINGSPAEMNQSILLKKGDFLVVETGKKGTYTYLSIGGLLQASEAFGSYSTYLPARFGGLEGRTLKKGDILSSRGTEAYTGRTIPEWSVSKFPDRPVIRILKGPEWETLSDAKTLEQQSFEVHASSNRMGIRLTNTPLKNAGREIASCPVIPGTIQLPDNGEPIVLMNDCQTTGGYPRIGKVIAADMDRLAQLRAGHCLKFRLVDREEARNQQRFREQPFEWIMG